MARTKASAQDVHFSRMAREAAKAVINARKGRSRSRSRSRSPGAKCSKHLMRKKKGYLARIKVRGSTRSQYWFLGPRGGLKKGSSIGTAKYVKLSSVKLTYVLEWVKRTKPKCLKKKAAASAASPRRRRSRTPLSRRQRKTAIKKLKADKAAGRLKSCGSGRKRRLTSPRRCYLEPCTAGKTRDRVTKKCRAKKR